jgi:hypothetical protein
LLELAKAKRGEKVKHIRVNKRKGKKE